MNKRYNIIGTIVIVLLFILSIIGIILFYPKNDAKKEFEYLKNYRDNEYMPVYISDEKMAAIYYEDYLNYLKNDEQKAYDLIAKKYRDKKFPTIESFREYAKSFTGLSLNAYSIVDKKDRKIFYIRLDDESFIIFLAKGVLSYEVYFDEFTVPIE